MKKIFLIVLFIFALGAFKSVSAESDNESYIDFDEDTSIKFVQKMLDPDKVEKYLSKYDIVLIYHTRNKDTDNLPIAEFVIKQDGKTLYKDYYTIQENSIKLKKDLKKCVKDAEEIILNFSDYFTEDDSLTPSTLLQTINVTPTFLINVQKDEIIPQELALVSGGWSQNSVVHIGEKAFEPYGKINYTMKYYGQVEEDHYFTRVENHVEFIPGNSLRNSGDYDYQAYYIDDIARHKVTLSKYGYSTATGDEPKGIDYWPINGSGTYTVSSGWGLSADIGYSQADGFNGGLVGSFNRSTSYSGVFPELDAFQITVGSKFNWAYDEFGEKDDVTLHHYPGIIVEQKTDTPFEGSFRITQEFHMLVDRWFYAERPIDWSVSINKIGQ